MNMTFLSHWLSIIILLKKVSAEMIRTYKTLQIIASSIAQTMSKVIISDLMQIFKSSVTAVLPEKLIRNTVKYNPYNELLTIAGENFSISKRNLYLVGTGKAVQYMAKEVVNIIGTRMKQGIISVPVGSLSSKASEGNVKYFEGAKNNLPDTDAQETALMVKNLVTQLTASDILLVLISGGGSALLPLPKEPMTLQEKTLIVKMLANAGADITELNTVRKRLSQLKGGQLAIMAQPAEVISLILSDIVGDPLDHIASGPTTENEDDPKAAIHIIKKYDLYNKLPSSIKLILEDTSNQKYFPKNKVKNHIIGSNKLCIEAAVNASRALSYTSVALSNSVTGNVKDIAQKYVMLSKLLCDYLEKEIDKDALKAQIDTLNVPGLNKDHIDNINISNPSICLVLGGEITVEVKGKGKGGRNQQLALEFSNVLNDTKDVFKNFEVYLLSAGTDGIDGPTDAAGAIGYINLISEAKEENINVQHYIKNNDSYNFYNTFKGGQLHAITGHTNTNVMDIHLILIRRK